MSNLLKYWVGHDSALKSISSKPLLVTTRDAVIITAVTLVATLIMTWIFFMYSGTAWADQSYGLMTLQTIAISMVAQYAYEYSGVNNMLAESSMRYAKGSTLGKYASRREAMLYQCLYELLNVPLYKEKEATIRGNFSALLIIVTDPDLAGRLADAAGNNIKIDEIREKFPKKVKNIDKVVDLLSTDSLAAAPTLGDHITENMVFDILVNGFGDYVLDGAAWTLQIKITPEMTARADEIAKNCNV